MQDQIGREGAHHVLGAVAEVDDVQHSKDHGKAQTQKRVERAIDQADQQLPEQRLRGDAENLEHGLSFYAPAPAARQFMARRIGIRSVVSRSPADSYLP